MYHLKILVRRNLSLEMKTFLMQMTPIVVYEIPIRNKKQLKISIFTVESSKNGHWVLNKILLLVFNGEKWLPFDDLPWNMLIFNYLLFRIGNSYTTTYNFITLREKSKDNQKKIKIWKLLKSLKNFFKKIKHEIQNQHKLDLHIAWISPKSS